MHGGGLLATPPSEQAIEVAAEGGLQPALVDEWTQGLIDITIGTDLLASPLRCQPLCNDPFVSVARPDARALPERPDVAAFCKLPHLDVSPSRIGLLRAGIVRALAELGDRRELRCLSPSFMAVPSIRAWIRPFKP